MFMAFHSTHQRKPILIAAAIALVLLGIGGRAFRRRLADGKLVLLIEEPPLVEVVQHRASRLFGKVGGARQACFALQPPADLFQHH